jgi:hypothetical protein
MYKNTGNFSFEPISGESPLESMYAGYGVACSDVDLDGDMDMLLANSGNEGGNQLFMNKGTGNNWISIKLEGIQSNKSGIGSRVFIRTNGIKQMDEVIAGSGYLSQNSLTLHFGLENSNLVDELVIWWPSGQTDSYEDLEVNKIYFALEGVDIYTQNEGNVVTSTSDIFENKLKVYPNPFSDYFQLNSDGLPIKEIRLTDLTGKTVFQELPGESSYLVNGGKLSFLAPGIYFLHLEVGDQRITKRITKL